MKKYYVILIACTFLLSCVTKKYNNYFVWDFEANIKNDGFLTSTDSTLNNYALIVPNYKNKPHKYLTLVHQNLYSLAIEKNILDSLLVKYQLIEKQLKIKPISVVWHDTKMAYYIITPTNNIGKLNYVKGDFEYYRNWKLKRKLRKTPPLFLTTKGNRQLFLYGYSILPGNTTDRITTIEGFIYIKK